MKKGSGIAVMLLSLLFLFGCSGDTNTEPEKEPENTLAGKTFFNVYEAPEGWGHSFVRFAEDLTFALTDSCCGNPVEYKGTYAIGEDAVILTVTQAGQGDLSRVEFCRISDEALSLQTKLSDSFEGNIYLCCETAEDLEGAVDAQRVNAALLISGKTYYNEVDRYGNTDTSFLTFHADGTFEMKEHYHEKFISITGKWEAKEYQIRCAVEQSGAGDFKEISFYLDDFEKLLLETDLFSSQKNDTFTSQKITITPATPEVGPYRSGTFTNASQKDRGSFGASVLTLRQDGTFTLDEVAGMGVTQINGLYGVEDNVLMFSNFDSKLYNFHGEEMQNFEFFIVDDSTLELMRDLEGSRAGDCFSVSGTIPNGFSPRFLLQEINCTVYLHEPTDTCTEEYLPKIELYSDGSFAFTENCFEGMGEYQGTYSEAGTQLILKVTEKASMAGFAGQDVEQIILERSSHGYILRTELCMSRDGDEFILQ